MTNPNHRDGMLCMVVALPAEAAPLIQHFKLEQENNCLPFQWYRRANCALVVSGIGKFHSAAALGFAHAKLQNPRQCAWLNVGIAGHSHAPRAAIFHAAKITDGNLQRFPICTFDAPTVPETVHTVDKVEEQFRERGAYDMEAAGFAAAASRLSSVELVHSVKVISDGPGTNPTPISPTMVRELIQLHCDTIATWCRSLLNISRAENLRLQTPRDLENFFQRWHFTVAQRHQLEHQLRRWQAQFPKRSPLRELSHCRSASAVIEKLELQLAPVWSSL